MADFGAFRGVPARKESPSEATGATWRTLEPVPRRGRRAQGPGFALEDRRLFVHY